LRIEGISDFEFSDYTQFHVAESARISQGYFAFFAFRNSAIPQSAIRDPKFPSIRNPQSAIRNSSNPPNPHVIFF
jgi:hypothetical protein